LNKLRALKGDTLLLLPGSERNALQEVNDPLGLLFRLRQIDEATAQKETTAIRNVELFCEIIQRTQTTRAVTQKEAKEVRDFWLSYAF